MIMWNFFTLRRESATAASLRRSLVVGLILLINGCVMGPTPHPSQEEESGVSQDNGGVDPTVSDVLGSGTMENQDASSADTAAMGPTDSDDMDSNSETELSDTAADTASDVDVEVGPDASVRTESDITSDTAVDTAADGAVPDAG